MNERWGRGSNKHTGFKNIPKPKNLTSDENVVFADIINQDFINQLYEIHNKLREGLRRQ